MPSDEACELTDDEGVLMLKMLRNNPFNHVVSLTFLKEEVVITFRDGIPEAAHVPREEVLKWKDAEWKKFFDEHEPLM